MEQSYFDLLSGEGGSQPWGNIDEFNPIGDEATPNNATQDDVLLGPKRKLNFSEEEDLALTSAWLNVSIDAVTGNQQSKNTYWHRMHADFENNLGRSSDRTESSLSHRWHTIQSIVNKWCSAYETIVRKNASGTCAEDKLAATHQLYKNTHKKTFTLMSCWTLLRHEPKWNNRLTCKKAKKSAGDSPGSSNLQTFSSVNIDDDMSQESSELNRPIGTKAAKAKKKKEIDDRSSSFHTAIEATQATRIVCEQKRDDRFERLLTIEQTRIELQKQKEERERIKEERMIMDVDLSNLTGARLTYYRRIQDQIIQRTMNNE